MFASLKKNHYRVCVVDPPWRFAAGTERRPLQYPRMRDKEIAAMTLASLAHPEGCWFFVWITSPNDGPRFWEGVWPGWKAQGLKYSGRGFVWVKTKANSKTAPWLCPDSFHTGMGFGTRKNPEDMLLFKIGRPKRAAADVQELIISPVRVHSRKPDDAFERIERFCAGPRAELFSRETRPGWDAHGLEAGKFD